MQITKDDCTSGYNSDEESCSSDTFNSSSEENRGIFKTIVHVSNRQITDTAVVTVNETSVTPSSPGSSSRSRDTPSPDSSRTSPSCSKRSSTSISSNLNSHSIASGLHLPTMPPRTPDAPTKQREVKISPGFQGSDDLHTKTVRITILKLNELGKIMKLFEIRISI